MDNKSQFKHIKIAVIGLGLIGGSLAKAFKNRLGVEEIIGYGKDKAAINSALREGIISKGFESLNSDISRCDAVFICSPVNCIIDNINEVSKLVDHNCIVTDVGSTKSEILRHVNSMPSPPVFVGGHPMTGSEKSGYFASMEHLFENAWYVLTPSHTTTAYSLQFMTEMVKGIGALPLTVDADEHDAITAGISHVPHIVAASLVNAVSRSDSPEKKMQLLAAGGFRDITRIASSSPELWESILASNKRKVSEALENIIDGLKEIKNDIMSGNREKVISFFREAKTYRDAMPLSKKGLLAPLFDISVDILDKPGSIGRVATLLGHEGINIKNIHVSNNREFENGCLRISFNDVDSMKTGSKLLKENGYDVTIDQSP